MKGSLFQIITYIETTDTWEEKAEQTMHSEKGILHRQVDLPPQVSVEATGVCIPVGNCEILLAAVIYL
jgi:hypothetical protein